MAYGLTSFGFNTKTQAQIIDDINAACLANISPTLNLSAASALGQLIGIVGTDLAELWNLSQAVYAALDPDQAAGDQLAALALLTGTVKRAATFSVAKQCTVNVNPGTYAIGSLVAYVNGNPAAKFSNLQAVTNSGGSAANFSVDFQALVSGPALAPSGTLTVISTPVSGWNSVTNPTDAVAGLPIQTDPQLRTARAQALQSGGAATAGAIRSAILNNLGQAVGGDVISATVLWNDTDLTDVNGTPPHSFEAIVLGAVMDSTANTALATQLLASKTAGDRAYGTSSLVINDSQGNAHTIGYTRPSTIPIYILITVQHDPLSLTPVTAATVQAALVAWAQASLTAGVSVVIEKVKSIALGVAGAYDITACTIGTAPAPAGVVNVPITVRQIATLITANIGVTII